MTETNFDVRNGEVDRLIKFYNKRIKAMQTGAIAAVQRNPRKTIEGQIRSMKGTLVEQFAGEIMKSACMELGISKDRVKIERKFKIETNITDPNYIGNLDDEVAKYVADNIADFVSYLEVDRVLLIDGLLVLGVECKSFTEKTMFTRAVHDAGLLYKYHPNRKYIVLQLENALGGDYAEDKDVYLGSPAAHIAMSDYPHLDIEICTLLNGSRCSNKPIHKRKYFKDMSVYKLNRTLDKFEEAITINLKALPHKRIYKYNYSYIY